MEIETSGRRSAALALAGAAAIAGVGMLGLSSRASAATPPPLPTAVSGHSVAAVARGIATPTAFAFDRASGVMFIGAFGDERTGKGGGVFTLAPGAQPVQVAGVAPG
ncbi:MAG: hypothetical protein ACYCXW_22200, partial [Solirubrobacteraceae bacterium]